MAKQIILLSLIVVTLLLISSLVVLINSVTPANAQQQAGAIPSGDRAARNWEYANHDSWASNYSPQTEINKDNVQYLELKWLFPNPSASAFLGRQPGVGQFSLEGSFVPNLVVDGVIYHATNMRNVYAFDGVTGKTKWTSLWELDYAKNAADQAARGLVGTCDGSSVGSGHVHSMNYINGVLYPAAVGGHFNAIDPSTGKELWRVGNICADIEGNVYKWPGADGAGRCPGGGYAPAVYRKENILMIGMCGADGNGGGRPFVDGYDLKVTPPKRLWRTYMAPAAPEGDPEWAIKACSNAKNGWYFSYPAFYKDKKLGINCKDVPRENVINDWGVPKFWGAAPSQFWGQWSVDEDTGLVYLGTGNNGGGNNNATFWTPGPNLFAGTSLALDAKTGQIVWWYQHQVRDMMEGDNSWNVVLANIGGRKTIIKHNTQGLIWALDAATGEPRWLWEPSILRTRVDPDGAVRGRTGCTPRPGGDPATQDGFWRDVMSKFDMQDKRWFNYPSTGKYCWIVTRPGESDIALNTDTNTIFVQIALTNAGAGGTVAAKCDIRADLCSRAIPASPAYDIVQNTTIYAVDATTGKEKWNFFIPNVGVRGGTIVSGGVVYVNSVNGFYYALDEATGKVLNKIFLGAASVSQATIGKTAAGKSVLLLKTGGQGSWVAGWGAISSQIPGGLFVYGLPDQIPQPQVIIKEVIKEVPKEVIKEVVKEVPKEVVKEVVKEVPKEVVKEVVKEVPKEVIKEVVKEVTKTVTVETINPISYAAIGLGVVLVVVSGVLFSRRKKV